MQNFRLRIGDSATEGGAMLFVRNGEGEGVGASGWSSAQCWVPCSLTFFVSPRPVRGTVGVVTLQLSHQGRRRDDTSCELFHIWAIINHRLRLGAETARGRPCGAGAVTCLLTDERSNPPPLLVATEPMRICCLHPAGKISATRIDDGAQNILVTEEEREHRN